MIRLDPTSNLVLARLQTAEGDFVTRADLARFATGGDDSRMSAIVAKIRRLRPQLVIEGRQGSGYRLVPPGGERTPPGPTPRRHATPVTINENFYTGYQRQLGLLDALPEGYTARLRHVMLETGESADEAIARLLDYGFEEHEAKCAAVTNPLLLRRVA